MSGGRPYRIEYRRRHAPRRGEWQRWTNTAYASRSSAEEAIEQFLGYPWNEKRERFRVVNVKEHP